MAASGWAERAEDADLESSFRVTQQTEMDVQYKNKKRLSWLQTIRRMTPLWLRWAGGICPIYPEYQIRESDDLYLDEGTINWKRQWTMESWIRVKRSHFFIFSPVLILTKVYLPMETWWLDIAAAMTQGCVCLSLCMLKYVCWYALTWAMRHKVKYLQRFFQWNKPVNSTEVR